jgi:hypothetical protein
MTARLTLAVRGAEFKVDAEVVEMLANALRSSLAGENVLVHLEPNDKPAKSTKTPSFRFVTRRGAERLSQADQRELLLLCMQVLAGEDRCWPPTFTTTFIGSTSD